MVGERIGHPRRAAGDIFGVAAEIDHGVRAVALGAPLRAPALSVGRQRQSRRAASIAAAGVDHRALRQEQRQADHAVHHGDAGDRDQHPARHGARLDIDVDDARATAKRSTASVMMRVDADRLRVAPLRPDR